MFWESFPGIEKSPGNGNDQHEKPNFGFYKHYPGFFLLTRFISTTDVGFFKRYPFINRRWGIAAVRGGGCGHSESPSESFYVGHGG